MQYTDYYSDLATRCQSLVKSPNDSDYKTTFLLSILSISLIVPQERLYTPNPARTEYTAHPSGDSSFELTSGITSGSEYSKFVKEKLADFMPGHDFQFWKYGKVKILWAKTWATSDVESQIEASQKIPGTLQIKEVAKILRDALAHGSIWTNANEDKEIQYIIFFSADDFEKILSEKSSNKHNESISAIKKGSPHDFKFIKMPASDLNKFVDLWLKKMASIKRKTPE